MKEEERRTGGEGKRVVKIDEERGTKQRHRGEVIVKFVEIITLIR